MYKYTQNTSKYYYSCPCGPSGNGHPNTPSKKKRMIDSITERPPPILCQESVICQTSTPNASKEVKTLAGKTQLS